MATLALAPADSRPLPPSFCASAVVRTPPLAFTPTSSPTTLAHQAMSSAVAPARTEPVLVLTKAAPAAFDNAQAMIFLVARQSTRLQDHLHRFGFAACRLRGCRTRTNA